MPVGLPAAGLGLASNHEHTACTRCPVHQRHDAYVLEVHICIAIVVQRCIIWQYNTARLSSQVPIRI